MTTEIKEMLKKAIASKYVASAKLIDLITRKTQVQREMAVMEAMTLVNVNNVKNADGKPTYPSESVRNAAVLMTLDEDVDYKSLQTLLDTIHANEELAKQKVYLANDEIKQAQIITELLKVEGNNGK